MREDRERFIVQTREFWQNRSAGTISTQDARQILCNISGFFQILSEWDATSQTQNQVPQLVLEQQQEGED